MFHHDSPYDACSPQFNRTDNNTAPINAFDRSVDPITNALLEHHKKREDGIQHQTPADDLDGQRTYANYDDPYAVPQSMGYDGPTDADNPNSVFYGVTSEPWQEFSRPVKEQTSPTQQQNPKPETKFEDMETILRGGRRTQPDVSTTSYKDPLDLSSMQDHLDVKSSSNPERKSPRSKSGTLSRSKSLLARFRRMRVDPDQSAESENPPSTPPLPVQEQQQQQWQQQHLSSQRPYVNLNAHGVAGPVTVDPAPTTTTLQNQPSIPTYQADSAKSYTMAPPIAAPMSNRQDPSSLGYDTSYAYGTAYSKPLRRGYSDASAPPPPPKNYPTVSSSSHPKSRSMRSSEKASSLSYMTHSDRAALNLEDSEPPARVLRRLATGGRSQPRPSV